MNDTRIEADFLHTDGATGRADVGTTQGPRGWVYLSQRFTTGTDVTERCVNHFSPDVARDVAAALLIAADQAEAEAPKPVEPPIDTVVLDRTGIAWQRGGSRWNCSLPSAGLGLFITVDELDSARGPLTLLEVAA